MYSRYNRFFGPPPAWFQALSGPAQLGALILMVIALPFTIPLAILLLYYLLSTVLLDPLFWWSMLVIAVLLLFQK